jgi:hypothetical protein
MLYIHISNEGEKCESRDRDQVGPDFEIFVGKLIIFDKTSMQYYGGYKMRRICVRELLYGIGCSTMVFITSSVCFVFFVLHRSWVYLVVVESIFGGCNICAGAGLTKHGTYM